MPQIGGTGMRRLPTDLQILTAIYDRYYDVFAGFEGSERASKIYVPIDIKTVANDLGVDPDIVFGRLYYHLDKRYGYVNDDGSKVRLFSPRAGGDQDCVQFPLAAAVLADLREQARRHRTSTWIAAGSLVVSLMAIMISILGWT